MYVVDSSHLTLNSLLNPELCYGEFILKIMSWINDKFSIYSMYLLIEA